jgi:uncharacterized protein
MAIFDIHQTARGDREEFFYFKNGEHVLFGAHFEPRTDPTGLGVVLCAPFAEEKIYTHRLLTHFGRQLAKLGISALRFDCFGEGDSSGEFEEATVETRVSDTIAALDWLKAQPHVNRLMVVGLRMGTVFAALAAARRGGVDFCALWDPVVDLNANVEAELRIALSVQTVLFRKIVMNRKEIAEQLLKNGRAEYEGIPLSHFQGWVLGKEFYEQAIQVDLRKDMTGFKGKCLLLPIAKKEHKPSREVTELESVLEGQGASVKLDLAIEDLVYWSMNLEFSNEPQAILKKTLDWMREVGA